MKRYRLIYRENRDAYYCFDTHTKKRESLGINDADEAQRLVDARNEAVRHVAMNRQIAQVYLQLSDPPLAMRTWQNVMEAMVPLKTGATQSRWTSAMGHCAWGISCRLGGAFERAAKPARWYPLAIANGITGAWQSALQTVEYVQLAPQSYWTVATDQSRRLWNSDNPP